MTLESTDKRRLPRDTSFPWEEAAYQSKANCIRKALAEFEPGSLHRPGQIANYLKERGVTVSQSMISIILREQGQAPPGLPDTMRLVARLYERAKVVDGFGPIEEWLRWVASLGVPAAQVWKVLQQLQHNAEV